MRYRRCGRRILCLGAWTGAIVAAREIGKMLAGACDRKTFFVEQAFDLEYRLDVFATVEAMTARAFHRLESREFRFPIAKDESFRGRQSAHFADAEKTLLRKFRRSLRSTGHIFSVS